jgi:hypothetical protein
MSAADLGDPRAFEGVVVKGPKGTKPITLSAALVEAMDLRPGKSDAKVEDWTSVLAIRARLVSNPDALWSDARTLARKVLDLPDAEVVVSTSAFEHVSGPASGEKGKAARIPGKSATYRSLAAALVHRDARRFVPGKPNNDWRTRPRLLNTTASRAARRGRYVALTSRGRRPRARHCARSA